MEARKGEVIVMAPDSAGVSEWALKITGGVHKGAMTILGGSEFLVVGASDDCDLILADAGVAGHHCMLKHYDSKLFLRPMEGPMIVNGVRHNPGETVWVPLHSKMNIGTAAFEIIDTREMIAVPPESSIPAHPTIDLSAVAVEPVSLVGLLAHSRWAMALCIAVLAGMIFTFHTISASIAAHRAPAIEVSTAPVLTDIRADPADADERPVAQAAGSLAAANVVKVPVAAR